MEEKLSKEVCSQVDVVMKAEIVLQREKSKLESLQKEYEIIK